MLLFALMLASIFGFIIGVTAMCVCFINKRLDERM